jgi:hypothetical protein
MAHRMQVDRRRNSPLGVEQIRVMEHWSRDGHRLKKSKRARFIVPVGPCGITIVDASSRQVLYHESLSVKAASIQTLRIE